MFAVYREIRKYILGEKNHIPRDRTKIVVEKS